MPQSSPLSSGDMRITYLWLLFQPRTLEALQALPDTRNVVLYCSLLSSSTRYHVGLDSVQTWKDGSSHMNKI